MHERINGYKQAGLQLLLQVARLDAGADKLLRSQFLLQLAQSRPITEAQSTQTYRSTAAAAIAAAARAVGYYDPQRAPPVFAGVCTVIILSKLLTVISIGTCLCSVNRLVSSTRFDSDHFDTLLARARGLSSECFTVFSHCHHAASSLSCPVTDATSSLQCFVSHDTTLYCFA